MFFVFIISVIFFISGGVLFGRILKGIEEWYMGDWSEWETEV